jgi:hypothetical protein
LGDNQGSVRTASFVVGQPLCGATVAAGTWARHCLVPTYDSGELNPYRRQDSGIKARHGRWEVRHDPYDISRIWIRNRHHGGWLSATWTHLRTGPVPFGELIWTHARQIVAARSTDPVTEAEIAAAAADLLDRAGQGPRPLVIRAGTDAAATA